MRYAGMGLELGGAVIGLTLLGLWIDYQFGTTPVGVLVGAGLGVIGGLYNFIKAALRLNRSSEPDRTKDDERG
jgi:F0F1-type ATP synthase assembly protein I